MTVSIGLTDQVFFLRRSCCPLLVSSHPWQRTFVGSMKAFQRRLKGLYPVELLLISCSFCCTHSFTLSFAVLRDGLAILRVKLGRSASTVSC